MYPLKQSTAITVPVFGHDVNGDAVTGMVDGGFTKRISKNGGAFAAMTVTITEMENGFYGVPLSTSHTDTLGILTILFTNASSKQINLQLRIHARVPDDLAFPATTGRSIDVTTGGAVGIDWANVEGQGTSVNLSATITNLVNTTTTNTDMRGTDSALLAASAPTNFGDLAITVTTGLVDINDKTGFSIAVGGIAATAFAAAAIDAAAIAANAIGSSELASSAVDEIVDQMFEEVRSDHATAGTFGESFQGVVNGAAEAGTLSTTQMTTDLSEATDEHYNGRTIIWITGVLSGQGSDITAYLGSTGRLTYTAVTEAPSATDRFFII